VDAVLEPQQQVEVAQARVGVDRHHGEVEPREGRGGSTTAAMEARRRQGRGGSTTAAGEGRQQRGDEGRPTAADRRCGVGDLAIWRFDGAGCGVGERVTRQIVESLPPAFWRKRRR
jgi:hypothetical protein